MMDDVLASPYALAAPFALVAFVLIARWFVRKGSAGSHDFTGMIVIGSIVAGMFVWIYAGLGLLARLFN
ncbi:MAG TPA: hypothetical protein VGF97_11675 [Rhizomicrobium sp.]|jgi:hypothetical protein